MPTTLLRRGDRNLVPMDLGIIRPRHFYKAEVMPVWRTGPWYSWIWVAFAPHSHEWHGSIDDVSPYI